MTDPAGLYALLAWLLLMAAFEYPELREHRSRWREFVRAAREGWAEW